MAEMKGIKLCGECGNYDYKKHRCRIGCIDDSNAQSSFYGDCPLPDVVPKSECAECANKAKNTIVKLQGQINRLKKYDEERDIALHARLIAETRKKVAREIFKEIERLCDARLYWNNCAIIQRDDIAELKKKYTEGESK